MKTRIVASFLLTVLLSGLAFMSAAQAQVGPDLTKANDPNAAQGEWIWGLLDDPVLLNGTTAIIADKETPSTIYVGGPGFIGKTNDSGATWTQTFSFSNNAILSKSEVDSEDLESENGLSSLTNEQRIEILRDYLQKELEDELDAESAESLLEDITDEEILDADSIEDIELLKDLDLKMESDLLHVLAEAELTNGANISEFDSFINRYIILKNSGAEEETAIEKAASNSSVWNFVSAGPITYAVTSDAIYMTSDKGQTWQTFLSTQENSAILSFDVSESNQMFAIGTTSGLLFTRNAGNDWIQLNDVIQGAVFRIDIQNENNVWVLTTDSIYHSTDEGLTWNTTNPPLGGNEKVIDVVPGMTGILVLTNQALYYSGDNGIKWEQIPCGPFSDEIIQQIVPTDPMLSSFIVRTDSHVYQYTANGWVSLNDMLFAVDLGQLVLLSDEYSLAAMATTSGVWLAQNVRQLAISEEYKQLFATWAKEPTDYEVIERALETHYLDDSVEHRWGLRSRLAWLLPTLTFDYVHLQTNSDRSKVTATFTDLAAMNYQETLTFVRQKQTYWQVMARWNIEIAKGQKTEIAGDKQEITLKSRRTSLINNVKKLIKKRRASQATLILNIPKLPENKMSTKKKYVKATLALQEAEASLHYLTGGYYIPAVHPENLSK